MFAQLLTIHAKLDDNFAVPTIFAFLPNKMKDTYRKLFKFLQTLVPNLATGLFLQTFSCDYEKGLIEAARIEFDPLNQTMKIGTFRFLNIILQHQLVLMKRSLI